MKKVLKWTGIVLAGVVLVIVVALSSIYVISNQDLSARYDIEPAALEIPEPDSAMLARGEHVSQLRGCTGCHSSDLGGEVMVEDPGFGTLSSANITPGSGSAVLKYTDKDWVRSIRHAVAPDGRPLMIMPPQEFLHIGRDDLVALIAYLKQVPPVDRVKRDNTVGPVARALHVFNDDFPLLNVEKVDHSTPIPTDPEPAVNAEFGSYIAVSCVGCHGSDLATPSPGPPGAPPPSDLTALDDWSEDDFLLAVREGIRPNGDTLHTFMPRWKSPTDTELKAVWAYIETLD